MAKEKSPWERFANREKERDAATKTNLRRPEKSAKTFDSKLDGLIARAESMIEQLQNLYSQYMAGAEKTPPNEKRKQLEILMNRIFSEPKPTRALQFRAQGIQAKFSTYRDRWDRLLLKLEEGKIHRKLT